MSGPVTSLFAVSILLSCLGCSREKPATYVSDIELLRGEIALCGTNQFGKVNFSFGCEDSVRSTLEIAVSLLHSFEYEEAEKSFVKVIDGDPTCVMGYWGVAMSIYHSLWGPPGEKDMIRGAKIIEIARQIPKSEREEAYLNAIGSYFQDWERLHSGERAKLYLNGMEEIYNKYPNDTEAAIFYSLALNATADPADKSYSNQKRAGKILESLFPDQPDHPGIAHYLIHNYDNPELAHKALGVARKYASIAPSSAHAQHMPSHIFTRLGLWDESITSNLNSAEAAVCYASANQMRGHWTKETHAISYLVYAYLQKGDNLNAAEQYEYLKTMDSVYPMWDHRAAAYPFAAIPARIALENHDWKRASDAEIHQSNIEWEKFPWQMAIIYYARSLGSSRSGNIEKAKANLDSLKILLHQLVNEGEQYYADQVNIQVKTCEAWLEFKSGDPERALILMREAADMEDRTEKASVTPGEVLPARELLGDLLMLLEKPEQALQAYEINLQLNPNRFNGLYGAGLSAKMAGDHAKAQKYFKQLITMVDPDSNRAELQNVKEFLED